MRNASCNVFGIPHFIRASDAHIAEAIYFLFTPTTLRLTHNRHQAITLLRYVKSGYYPRATDRCQ